VKRVILNALRPIAERFPRLLMAYRITKAHWHLIDEPVKTPFGFRLGGNTSMQRGEFEQEETLLVARLLLEVDLCLNVGANIGYYCCLAASAGKRVIAFEPNSVNLQYVLKNVDANGWGEVVTVVPKALCESRGVARIYGGGTGASLLKGWARGPEECPTLVVTSTLDEEAATAAAGKRCLVVADIEGAELRMLQGATRLLEMLPRPVWVVEISIGEHQPKGLLINPNLLATFEFFWSRGYEAWTTTRPYRPVLRAEVSRIAELGVDTLQTHNFLFAEGGKPGLWRGADGAGPPVPTPKP
jgi:FkbM family methyltransferase